MVIKTTDAAKINVISRAISSPSRSFDRKEREPDIGPAPCTVGFAVATFSDSYCTFAMAFFSFSITSFGSFAYDNCSAYVCPSASIQVKKPLIASRFALS